MKTNNDKESTEKIKVQDTLLALHHQTNTIGIVQGVDLNGQLIVDVSRKSYKNELRFDRGDDRFLEIYSTFYHQLKTPDEFSFFKVTEFEAEQTVKDLQHYIDTASDDEKEKLSEYSVSIDKVEAQKEYIARNQKDRYQYDPEQVDWKMMSQIGLTREKLESMGALESLLKGYKTSMLIPVKIDRGTVISTLDARLSLKVNEAGKLETRIHPIRKECDFTKPFFGHQFSQEDQEKLLEIGNMGRVVELIHPITGEVIASLVSRDKLTNDLVPLRADLVRIPLVIKGVTLDEVQKKTLKEGKPLYIENMLSRRGTLFNATVQFNTDKRYVEFLFPRNISNLNLDSNLSSKTDVLATFRGKKLRLWQVEKLNKGEVAYIDVLVDRKGKKYQGYLRFDKRVGKFEFSFKNVWRENLKNKKSELKKNNKL
ncbi:DUF3945 domain-containing protein [Chryseobacterium cucumeris]|uniref:DUF3945 domain-containing protein n=1 Tax=Chryseobacterium cucumeris TaxID=1813611 RepID=UPI001F4BAB0D|nr:DUF3945 domain-containing protein [Chryseobacterium cucumeris]